MERCGWPLCLVVIVSGTCLLSMPILAADEPITLVENGRSEYVVMVSNEASPSERWAAEDLVDHIRQMSGAVLSITTEGGRIPEKAVLIGDGQAVRSLGIRVEHEELGTDGFIIRTTGQRLVVAGGRRRGTMYGVYDLLAGLGCRWWAPGESTIPDVKTITLPPTDLKEVPVLEYRDMLYGDLWEGEQGDTQWLEGRRWCARNRIHAAYHEMPEELGPIDMDRAIAHGLARFIPKDEYFDEHPEYYALRRGSRDARDVCWSNEGAATAVAQHVIEMLDEQPKWRLITLGQSDYGVVCECEGCKALVEKHGANSGMVIHFINKVAEIVGEKHPDVWLNTNAYRWSQKAPTGIRCADNVMITIPPIACNYAQPLAEGWPEENAQYKRDLEDWAKICNKIYVWDYTTNFVHYVMPWPNFYVLQPNIKFFVDHNVRGVFEQGSHTTNNAQFSKLCMWVSAQAMWDPGADGRKLVEEFCMGYYGPTAGPLVLEYVNMLEDRVVKERIAIWATHRTHLSAPHLTPGIIARGERLFRQAEELVKDDPDLLRRVQVAHFPVQYMLLRRSHLYWEPTRKVVPELSWSAVAEQLSRVGRENGITRLAEGDHALQLYDWALDYARAIEQGKYPVAPELLPVDPAGYTFLQAAQLDKQVKFMERQDGATDGWAQKVISPGWSITNSFSAPGDFTPGKSYKLFLRLRGTAEGVSGRAIHTGIYQGPGARPCARSIACEELDGTWRTYEIGRWTPPESGGSFYICLERDNTSGLRDVYLDCLWLLETRAE